MNTFTRSSDLMTSSVGPSRFASTGVRVLVSERCIFFCSSGTLVSSGPGRGACIASVITETLPPSPASEHQTEFWNQAEDVHDGEPETIAGIRNLGWIRWTLSVFLHRHDASAPQLRERDNNRIGAALRG